MDRQPAPDGTSSTLDDAWREHRPYLLDLAFRMLGSIADAEDVTQEAFVRLMRVGIDDIDDLRGWLIVVVSRLCLDQLRSARARREDHSPVERPRELRAHDADPLDRVTLDDNVRIALLVVLERLTPAERVAFVLHDVFGFSFERVASIVGRTPAACRQLASRARRRVKEDVGSPAFDVDLAAQRLVVERFIAACAGGDLETLMQVLDPDVVGVADLGALAPLARPVAGRPQVARNLLLFFGPSSGITLVSQPVNGEPGALGFRRDGQLFCILVLTPRDGLIEHIHAVVDPEKLAPVAAQLAVGHQPRGFEP
jgi:RNA polymerase sigma-70 factor (ECF subfamily)